MRYQRVGGGLLLGVLAAAMPALAQPSAPAVTVGLLCVGDCPAPPFEQTLPTFVTTLRDAGYVLGQTIALDLRGIGEVPAQMEVLQ